MRILFIGGTGNISSACVREALGKGVETWILVRGSSDRLVPEGARVLLGDITDKDSIRDLLRPYSFDVVVDWVAYTPRDVERDLELFEGRTQRYVFISSASVYRRPAPGVFHRESDPRGNPFWDYAREKIRGEDLLLEAAPSRGIQPLIVRPSHTIGEGWIPTSFGSRDFTVPARILRGKPIVIHDDGLALWTLTHAEDFARAFVPLILKPSLRHAAYHITSPFAYTWEEIHERLAEALGKRSRVVYVPSRHIARLLPRQGASLMGDKRYTTLFDTSRLREEVPDVQFRIPLEEMISRSLAWYERHPEKQCIDSRLDEAIDRLVALQDRVESLWKEGEGVRSEG
ncbi:NAD-dependent epimerase/dehydratase [Spirochaeta thermophila DSM 6578]|uniref:NAD-dependent epimerase/dehydratase n=1 Tax=Winmispira thermophila (strain ATCC 700085 / DSM 6578 / Z-1203) TaxID=869211 RepID=G0GG56_WINT7|nr:NAD-dependent epimerase/dehydratase family protein [Spirochaeta thermophila]AEJ62532.1 NAD-dependent epimerase/dehydratase [Spirochaeta thermophila DSM 6578]